jgi:hypothetical protein
MSELAFCARLRDRREPSRLTAPQFSYCGGSRIFTTIRLTVNRFTLTNGGDIRLFCNSSA